MSGRRTIVAGSVRMMRSHHSFGFCRWGGPYAATQAAKPGVYWSIRAMTSLKHGSPGRKPR
jgi:hypothetical protein